MSAITHLNGYALNQARFWQFMLDKLDAGVDVMFLYVLESTGSSPGRQGFRMAVSADHDFCGSIGGGIMEHKFVELALDKLGERQTGGLFRQVHDKSAAQHQSGMICSGEQTIWMYPLSADDRLAIYSMVQSWCSLKSGALIIRPSGLVFSETIPDEDWMFDRKTGDDFCLTERTGFRNELHIIGGGHCSKALCELMSKMDFHITVYDDRDNLSTMRDNLFAHKKIRVDSYNALSELVPAGKRVYVSVMTFGYRTDDQAFRALAGRPYRYLGMLGSKRKVEKMFREYRGEGMQEAWLSRVYAPVGLSIKSETPEEIAISIAAQIISVKNQQDQ